MKKVVRIAVREASKRSVRVHNQARKIGNLRLRNRFNKLVEITDADEKTVVFLSFMGRGFSDSPLAMYLEMIGDPYFDDWKFVWVFKKGVAKEFNGKIELAKNLLSDTSVKLDDLRKFTRYTRTSTVVYNSLEYYQALAESMYWVSNSRVQEGVLPGKKHVYIQTWHGTPLKRLGADILNGANPMQPTHKLSEMYRQESDKWTYLLSPSSFYTDKMKTAFVVNKESKVKIIEKGYPRNDFLVNHTSVDVVHIKKRLGLPENKKVLLYAPTWRDNQHDLKRGYTYELGADFDKLKEELGDEWVILFRAHYFIANAFDFSKYEGFAYDVSKHIDINELYVVADCLMTDYSSVFFDYSILKRPMVFFMYDKQHYASELRGFYLDLDELPGEITETNDEVIAALQSINSYSKNYSVKLDKFTKRFCPQDDGRASKRVVAEIFKQRSLK
jgi:CDP-glycerol glycerophosphotransferase